MVERCPISAKSTAQEWLCHEGQRKEAPLQEDPKGGWQEAGVTKESGVETELDFGEDGGIGGGHGAFLRSDPCTHAIGGGVDSGERRAAQRVMNHGGGESVAGADGVGDFYSEAGMFVVRLRGDQNAAVGSAGNADQAERKFAAQPASGGDVRTF